MVSTQKSASIIYFLVAAMLIPFYGTAQGVNTTFGQNRLPYKKMDWQVLSSENVDAFYYEGGKNLAEYAQITAEENIGEIEDILSYRVGGKVEIAIFNTIEDLRQSNTGLKEQLFNVGGYTYVVDNKVIAYFNGKHSDFERQIKRGIAEIILSEMIYGSSIQERVQSSSLLFLPSWFFKGLTSYASEKWNTDIDSRVRDKIISGEFKKFNLLSEEDEILAGHSIWNYIEARYGKKTIPEILFLTRVSRGFEGAINYALGIKSSQLINDWLAYYKKKYSDSEADRNIPRKLLDIPSKISKYPHTQLKTHPNGRRVAFVMNKNGLWQVKVYDKTTKSEKTFYSGGKQEGYQVINYSYPVLAWEPKGRNLGVIFFDKGKTKLVKIDKNGKTGETFILPDAIDQVLSFDFTDKNTLLLSAIKNGQTDLYIYDIESKELKQLTNDIFDDLSPRLNSTQTQIIFSSNRPYDSLNFKSKYFETLSNDNNFDVFVFNYPPQNNQLKRITNTPFVNELSPVFYIPGFYSFTSDISGIYNAYACKEVEKFVEAQVFITYTNGKTDTIISKSPLPSGSRVELTLNGKILKIGG
jgi:Tol biopolymer transport system component